MSPTLLLMACLSSPSAHAGDAALPPRILELDLSGPGLLVPVVAARAERSVPLEPGDSLEGALLLVELAGEADTLSVDLRTRHAPPVDDPFERRHVQSEWLAVPALGAGSFLLSGPDLDAESLEGCEGGPAAVELRVRAMRAGEVVDQRRLTLELSPDC